MNTADASLEDLNRWMLAHHMHGFWMQGGAAASSQIKPCLWKWADVYAGCTDSPSLIQWSMVLLSPIDPIRTSPVVRNSAS